MPLYDYECNSCGKSWEEARRIEGRDYSDGEACPECGEVGSVRRNITGTTIVSGINLRAKVPQGFKDRLAEIKKNNPLNKIGGELS